MSNTIKTMVAAAATSFALTMPAVMAQESDAPIYCRGVEFDGDYIAKQDKNLPLLTAEQFNEAADENLVGSVEAIMAEAGILRLIQTDFAMNCEEFVRKVEDTGLVELIAPNTAKGTLDRRPLP